MFLEADKSLSCSCRLLCLKISSDTDSEKHSQKLVISDHVRTMLVHLCSVLNDEASFSVQSSASVPAIYLGAPMVLPDLTSC
ncbi:unnamed protein product [Urochloa humidicola]